MPLRVEIVTAERQVLTDEVDMVIAPAADGVIGILPRHAPLLTALAPGALVLRKGNLDEVLSCTGGFLEVSQNKVLILADAAEREDEIDEERATNARARAEAALQEAAHHPDAALRAEAARTSLRSAQVRLNVAQRRRRRSQ